MALSENHLCLADTQYYYSVSMLLFINSRLPNHLWKELSKCWFEGNRLGGKEKHRGPCCKKDQERQGYTFSEREPQRRDESVRGGLGMKEMKCVLERGWCMEKRISLNANSSHLERLTDREQHFCTYPGSLPPHSITRQSIKSSKKTQKGTG